MIWSRSPRWRSTYQLLLNLNPPFLQNRTSLSPVSSTTADAPNTLRKIKSIDGLCAMQPNPSGGWAITDHQSGAYVVLNN